MKLSFVLNTTWFALHMKFPSMFQSVDCIFLLFNLYNNGVPATPWNSEWYKRLVGDRVVDQSLGLCLCHLTWFSSIEVYQSQSVLGKIR